MTCQRRRHQGPLVLEDFDLGHELKDIFQGMRIVATDVPNELVRALPAAGVFSPCFCCSGFVRWQPTNEDAHQLGEIDIHYTNGVNLRLSTSLIKLNVQIPLVVAIDLNLLVGKVGQLHIEKSNPLAKALLIHAQRRPAQALLSKCARRQVVDLLRPPPRAGCGHHPLHRRPQASRQASHPNLSPFSPSLPHQHLTEATIANLRPTIQFAA